jgi:GNAT superfamily N-acetyltransferase
VRIHSRKKAQSDDPKPATPPAGENSLDQAATTGSAKITDNHEDDSDGEYPVAADDPKFHPTPGNDTVEPLEVGYLRDELAEYDEFAKMRWLEAIDVVATCFHPLIHEDKDRNRVGFCGAKLIRRKKFRRMFHQQMCKPFDESTLMAFDIFDQYGRLKDIYKVHKYWKGSEVWQQQLDEGDILLIEDVTVDAHYRRRGLATAMVRTLFEAARRKTEGGNFVAILWPQSSKDDHFQDLLKSIVSTSCGLFRAEVLDRCDSMATPWARSLGFRRIGLSMWFGLLCTEGHITAVLPIERDRDPKVLKPVKKILPDSIKSAGSDKEFLAAIQRHYRHVQADDRRWLATDHERNTLLHLASLQFFRKSLAWIMEQSCSNRLLKMRNSSRFKPLEALLEKLEIMRSRKLVGNLVMFNPDEFEGHTLDQARCIALLKNIEIDSEEDLEQFRYGCTCDECHEGFISPRMRLTLYMTAETEQCRLEESLLEMSGKDFLDENESILDHFPAYSIKYMEHYKAIRKGLIKACEHVADCLLDDLEPTEGMIKFYMGLSEDKQPDLVERFFRAKTNIAGVVGMIMESASFSDEIHGYGWIRKWMDDEEEEEDEPACRNDHEFVLVARKCGYPAAAEMLSVMSKAMCLPLS